MVTKNNEYITRLNDKVTKRNEKAKRNNDQLTICDSSVKKYNDKQKLIKNQKWKNTDQRRFVKVTSCYVANYLLDLENYEKRNKRFVRLYHQFLLCMGSFILVRTQNFPKN